MAKRQGSGVPELLKHLGSKRNWTSGDIHRCENYQSNISKSND